MLCFVKNALHLKKNPTQWSQFLFHSRASKGFSGSQTMKQCGCVPAFTNLLQLFGLALDTPVQRSHVQTGVRQFVHRMVVCLDAEILPFIPPLMTRLLKHPDVRELYDFLPLLNQLIMKFKASSPVALFLLID